MSNLLEPLRKVTVSYWRWEKDPDQMWFQEDFLDGGVLGGPRPEEEVEGYIEFLRQYYDITDLGEIEK